MIRDDPTPSEPPADGAGGTPPGSDRRPRTERVLKESSRDASHRIAAAFEQEHRDREARRGGTGLGVAGVVILGGLQAWYATGPSPETTWIWVATVSGIFAGIGLLGLLGGRRAMGLVLVVAAAASGGYLAHAEVQRRFGPEPTRPAIGPERADELVREGMLALQRTDYDRAVASFEEVASAYPDREDVARRLVEARALAEKRRRALLDRARQLVAAARETASTGSCDALGPAKLQLQEVLTLVPDHVGATELLPDVLERWRACFHGDGELALSVRIRGSDPVEILVRVRNDGESSRRILPERFALVDAGGNRHRPVGGSEAGFEEVELLPGEESAGILEFDVSIDATALAYRTTNGEVLKPLR